MGPENWQDWYRQIEKTVHIARVLEKRGDLTTIVLLSNFQPRGKQSELEIYGRTFKKLSPELKVLSINETSDTLGQVEKSFELSKEMNADLIFVSAWMQFLRVIYLSKRRPAQYYGVFGIPQPAFAIIDPLCIIFEPLIHLFGLAGYFSRRIVKQRQKGKIL